jgi:Xaa-Pro aminopeptidase
VNADARLASLRLRLADSEADGLYVTSIHNVVYLTGFDGVFDEGASAACLITAERAIVYTDSRYAEVAALAATGTAWSVVITSDSLDTRVCEEFTSGGSECSASRTRLPSPATTLSRRDAAASPSRQISGSRS